MILAGDIGGTKTNLALFEPGTPPRRVRSASARSADYPGLDALLRSFLGEDVSRVRAAAFGVAGPVAKNRVQTTNLAWPPLDGDAIAAALGVPRVDLLNDLVATALGVGALPPGATVTLQEGQADPDAPVAVIAAGTGLGMSAVLPSPAGPVCLASEGGHVDWAPRDEREIRLLRYLSAHLQGRVSVERVVSGPGLWSLYRFLRDVEGLPETPEVRAALDAIPAARLPEEAGAVISAHSSRCPLCDATFAMFTSSYGAAAGNLALLTVARGGLYVAGGVAAKNAARIQDGTFLASFLDKGRYAPLLREIPVRVVLDQEVGLLGAAIHAFR